MPERILSFFLPVLIPVCVICLIGSLLLRLPQTYEFYFNDTNSLDDLDYVISVDEMGNEIASYLSAPVKGEFQIYDVNGDYRDPIFDKKEQDIMDEARKILFVISLCGLIAGISALIIFRAGIRRRLRPLLRRLSFISAFLTVILVIVHAIVFGSGSFRAGIYERYIGIDIPETSVLSVALGRGDFLDPYVVFFTILSLAAVGGMIYVTENITRPDRIFR